MAKKTGYLDMWAIYFLGIKGKVREWKPQIADST